MDIGAMIGHGPIRSYVMGMDRCQGKEEASDDEINEMAKITKEAIEAGGTTLKDYTNAEEAPGYFKKELKVYDRAGEPCLTCGKALKEIRQSNRQTVYCTNCQS